MGKYETLKLDIDANGVARPEEAQRYGLIHQVVPGDQLDAAVDAERSISRCPAHQGR